MAKPTDAEKKIALLHATVWERAFHEIMESNPSRTDIDVSVLRTIATACLTVGGEYRRIANGAKIDD